MYAEGFAFSVFSTIASVLAECGQVDRALDIALEHLRPHGIGWTMENVAKALLKAGGLSASLELAEAMADDSPSKAKILAEISVAYSEAGDTEQASQSLVMAIRVAGGGGHECFYGAAREIVKALQHLHIAEDPTAIARAVLDAEKWLINS